MKSGVDGKEVNLPQLLLHASAFGLFTLCAVMFEIMELVNFYWDLKKDLIPYLNTQRIITNIALPINSAASSLSMILLAVILIRLSKPLEENNRKSTTSSSSIQSIKVEEFDEEAEVQARIWN